MKQRRFLSFLPSAVLFFFGFGILPSSFFSSSVQKGFLCLELVFVLLMQPGFPPVNKPLPPNSLRRSLPSPRDSKRKIIDMDSSTSGHHQLWGISSTSVAGSLAEMLNTHADVKSIDNIIKEARNISTTSVDSLTDSIQKLIGNMPPPSTALSEFPSILGDVRVLRGLFAWVCFNIDYDVVGLQSGDIDCSPEGVLRTRKAVCSGYSCLLKAMCTRAGLVVEAISGYSKGAGYHIGDAFADKKSDHEWNKVKLGDQWYLLDATWAAGHLDGTTYAREFNSHYWLVLSLFILESLHSYFLCLNELYHFRLTDPVKFVYDHFPIPGGTDQQLLEPPISLKSFESLVQLKSSFFVNNLQLKSHLAASIELEGCGSEIRLKFSAPLQTQVIASLETTAEGKIDDRTFIQRDGESVIVLARAPFPGPFELKLFSHQSSGEVTQGEQKYDWSASYLLQVAEEPSTPLCEFAKTYSLTACPGVTLFEPLNKILHLGTAILFRARAEGASAMSVITSNGKWNELENQQDGDSFTFSGLVEMETLGEVNFAVQLIGKSSFDFLASYECEEPKTPETKAAVVAAAAEGRDAVAQVKAAASKEKAEAEHARKKEEAATMAKKDRNIATASEEGNTKKETHDMRCIHCGKLIGPGQYYGVDEGFLHPECLQPFREAKAPVCAYCGKKIIDGKFYSIEDKKLHASCLEPYQAQLAPTCVHCGEKIMPGSSFYEIEGGKKVHDKCLEAATKIATKPPGKGSRIHPT